jgi:hypothetical protein
MAGKDKHGNDYCERKREKESTFSLYLDAFSKLSGKRWSGME